MQNTEFPYEKHHITVKEATVNLKGQVKACIRNAYNHLEKSWILYSIDKEMSLFRLITAEEEAATALIISLKSLKYPEAGKLNHRSHPHKCSVYYFMRAISNVFAKLEGVPKIEFSIDKDTPKVLMRIIVDETTIPPIIGEVENPLDFLVQKEGSDIINIFSEEMKEITLGENFVRFANEKANLRNTILYANSDGYPSIEFDETYFKEYCQKIYIMSLLIIMISQTKKYQIFVTQCLHSFLKELEKIKDSDYDFDKAVLDASVR